jgi:hypothetical protein
MPAFQYLHRNLHALLLAALILLGSWPRLAGLGDTQLAQDEYYFIQGVRNIVASGLPEFPSGGYYTRGLLAQYLAALSVLCFGENGFAYRFPSALFGLGSLLVSYFLARLFLTRGWSLLLVGLLAFSSWGIEMSRFARMYPAAQFVTVCFFWAIYRWSFGPDARKAFILPAIAIVGVLTHEIGFFLGLLLGLPVLHWWTGKQAVSLRLQVGYLGACALTFLLGAVIVTYDFRHLGALDRLPEGFVEPAHPGFYWWAFGNYRIGGWFWMLAALTLIAVAVYAVAALRDRKIDNETQLLRGVLVLALSAAVLHQFAVSFLLLAVVFVRRPDMLVRRPYLYPAAGIFILLGVWSALFYLTPSWHELTGENRLLRAWRVSFFGRPDLHKPVLRPYFDAVPLLFLLLSAGIAVQLYRIRRLPWRRILRHPVMAVIVMTIAMGVEPPRHVATRYSYFLFPVALLMVAMSGRQIGLLAARVAGVGRRAAGAVALVMVGAFFTFTEEINLSHFLNPVSEAATFRTREFERFQVHWYLREDFLRPAQLVNSRFQAGERVILSWWINTSADYLEPDFALHWPQEALGFSSISRSRGTRDMWAGARILSTPEDVRRYAENSDTVWLIIRSDVGDDLADLPERVWPGRHTVTVYKPGRDDRIEVWRVDVGHQSSVPTADVVTVKDGNR